MDENNQEVPCVQSQLITMYLFRHCSQLLMHDWFVVFVVKERNIRLDYFYAKRLVENNNAVKPTVKRDIHQRKAFHFIRLLQKYGKMQYQSQVPI